MLVVRAQVLLVLVRQRIIVVPLILQVALLAAHDDVSELLARTLRLTLSQRDGRGLCALCSLRFPADLLIELLDPDVRLR